MNHDYEILDPSGQTAKPARNWRRLAIYGGIGLVVVIVVVVLSVGLGVGLKGDDDKEEKKPASNTAQTLDDSMQITRLMTHLNKLQTVAADFNNSRAVRLGYNASVDYVVKTLKDAGYEPVVQPFTLPLATPKQPPQFDMITPKAKTYVLDTDYAPFVASPNVDKIFNVTIVANLGCNDADYTGFPAGNAALIMRGNCTFSDKQKIAEKNGAGAALVYNDGTASDRMHVIDVQADPTSTISAFFLSFIVGETILCKSDAGEMISVKMYSDSTFSVQYTSNVLIETKDGQKNNVIVVGSHLDSVEAGPGINDNGSGSSLNLELAIQFAKLKIKPVNQVRFGWWGAEELGLLGSKAYVNQTSADELAKIALYLNFDMVGSPNHEVAIYNGNDPKAPNGSAVIADLFATSFTEQKVQTVWTAFDGRSDYGPFIAIGIPAGGLFSGAEVPKTSAQRDMWGGMANAAYDPCYHARCDTTANINQAAYISFAKSAAQVLAELAMKDNLREYIKSTREAPTVTTSARTSYDYEPLFTMDESPYTSNYAHRGPLALY